MDNRIGVPSGNPPPTSSLSPNLQRSNTDFTNPKGPSPFAECSTKEYLSYLSNYFMKNIANSSPLLQAEIQSTLRKLNPLMISTPIDSIQITSHPNISSINTTPAQQSHRNILVSSYKGRMNCSASASPRMDFAHHQVGYATQNFGAPQEAAAHQDPQQQPGVPRGNTHPSAAMYNRGGLSNNSFGPPMHTIAYPYPQQHIGVLPGNFQTPAINQGGFSNQNFGFPALAIPHQYRMHQPGGQQSNSLQHVALNNQLGFRHGGFGVPPQMGLYQGSMYQQQGNPYTHPSMNGPPSHGHNGQHHPPNSSQLESQPPGNVAVGMSSPHGQNVQQNLPNNPQLQSQSHGNVAVGSSPPLPQNGQHSLPNSPHEQRQPSQPDKNGVVSTNPQLGQNKQYNQPRNPQRSFQPCGNVPDGKISLPPGHPHTQYNDPPRAQQQISNDAFIVNSPAGPHAHSSQSIPPQHVPASHVQQYHSQLPSDRNGNIHMAPGSKAFTTNPDSLPSSTPKLSKSKKQGNSNLGTGSPRTQQYHFIDESDMLMALGAESSTNRDRLPSSAPQASEPKKQGTLNRGTSSPKTQQCHGQPHLIGDGNLQMASGSRQRAETGFPAPFELNLPESRKRKSPTHSTATANEAQFNSQPQYNSNGNMHMPPGSGQGAEFAGLSTIKLEQPEPKKRKVTNRGTAEKMAPGHNGQKDGSFPTPQKTLEASNTQGMPQPNLAMGGPEPKNRKTTNRGAAESMAPVQKSQTVGGLPSPRNNSEDPQPQSMTLSIMTMGGPERSRSAGVTSNSDKEFTDPDTTPPNSDNTTPPKPQPGNIPSDDLSKESNNGPSGNPSLPAEPRDPNTNSYLEPSSGEPQEPEDDLNFLFGEPQFPILDLRPPSREPTPLPPSLPPPQPPHLNSAPPEWGMYELTAEDALYATAMDNEGFIYHPEDWTDAAAEAYAASQPAMDMDAFLAMADPDYHQRQRN